MTLPYVIDNRTHTLADVLAEVLRGDAVHALDVATAYFNIGAFDLLGEALHSLASFRLLLGAEPGGADDLGLRQALRRDLEAASFDEATQRLVEALTRFLRRDTVEVRLYQAGFLHAKSYLAFADRSPGDRFRPLVGIVGSSNFTRAGLTTNQELNLTHKVLLAPAEVDDGEAREAVRPVLDAATPPESLASPFAPLPGDEAADVDFDTQRALKSQVGARAILELLTWYEARWTEARDFKAELIELLDDSKFGSHAYTPYQIYLKALYTYFRKDLEDDGGTLPGIRSAVELTRFQEDAVKRARRILERYDGVLIADSVGLGKTWIGKKLLEDTAYHRRQKALVICPASLRAMWEAELREAAIPAPILSQEMLGRETCELRPYSDVDVILIDESHNFRNPHTNRYENLERLIAAHGGRGRDGARKQIIMLTATPINNTIFDLYHQLMLFTQGDRAYFAAAGIGDLRRYFLDARRQADGDNATEASHNEVAALFNLLEEVVVRRTRPFIRKAYPQATIRGKPIRWPARELRTVRYSLEDTYAGLYDAVVAGIERLGLVPYNLETYKRADVARDERVLNREQALIGIFKSRFLKRFESSVEAFRISIHRALTFFQAFGALLEEGQLLNSSDFRHVMRYLEPEDEESDVAPLDRLQDQDEARAILEALPPLDRAQYDLKRLRQALQNDIHALTEIAQRVQAITPARDAKLQRIKALLRDDLRGRKVILFTYYRDTAVYLHRELSKDVATPLPRGGIEEGARIARLDGDVAPQDRARRIADFAPQANDRPDLIGSPQEIDILISTDVLSEGQNLQDCGLLVNYDLHWNPTRMVQRAGRIDRLGSSFETLTVYNVFPEAGLERLLGLVQSLSRKIAAIDRAGMLDTSVLGEVVHPRNFNTLQRIAAEDAAVFDELEVEAELVSSEFLLATLRDVLARGDVDVAQWPDGIHSGRRHPQRGSGDPLGAEEGIRGSGDPLGAEEEIRESGDPLGAEEGIRESGDPLGAGGGKRYRGIFFYFTAPAASVEADAHTGNDRRHFWRYVDLATGQIHINRYEIANLIRCGPDEVRVDDPPDVNAFDVQPRVKVDILNGVRHRQAVAAAPKIVDKDQQLVATVLQQQINHPDVAAREVSEALKALRTPLPHAYLKDLRAAYDVYCQSGDIARLLTAVLALGSDAASVRRPPLRSRANGGGTAANGGKVAANEKRASPQPLTEDDLHLVCWEYIGV